jgi:SRR1
MAYVDEFENLPKEISVERIMCLGLGSLVEGARRISEVQLLLLLELRRLINVPTNHLDYTDLGSGDSLRSCIYGIGCRISSIIGDYRAGLNLFRHC